MSEMRPGPEHKDKNDLTDWLERHGARVWWEESNHWGHEQYTINREANTGGIPDLVVEIDGRVFVVEFKSGDGVGQIYDALHQLHGYWVEHIVNDQAYVVGGRSVTVDGFLTASKHSRFGRLFPTHAEKAKTTVDTMDDGRASCVKYGQLPPTEYRMTEQHVRTLWRRAKETLSNIEGVSQAPAVGALLSDHLEREQIDPSPAVLWNRGNTNQDWEVFD
jgi:hypothetical protein